MSRTKELITDRYADLWPDTIDADYRYEEWLKQQHDEEEYNELKAEQNENTTV